MNLSDKTLAMVARARARLRPPPEVQLSEWMDHHVRLPSGTSAQPGRFRNWPYFRDIANSIGDPHVERVTLVKATRIGFTKGVMGAIGASACMDPCPMILLVPVDDDVRGYAVEEIDPLFEASPELSRILVKGRGSTIDRKAFLGGASLKILAARSPRNLRRHDAKKLFCDEVDAMDITTEGDPIVLAERRTQAFHDRKIVLGSTPKNEDTSIVERNYETSDRRVFMIPCPHCGTRFELRWRLDDGVRRNLPDVPVGYIEWPKDELGRHQPEGAYAVCPDGCVIEERYKPEMIQKGQWVATRPEVKGHHGYRLNALVSLIAKASWGILAKEYIKAVKGGPAELQPFYNTALALPWKSSIRLVSAEALMSRVEGYGLYQDRPAVIPAWVVLITVGTDVQDDRLESTVLGWPLTGAPCVLGHIVHHGNTLEKEVWAEYDEWLKTKWKHPNGWRIGIDAAAVDSGGREGRTQKIYNFTQPRLGRRVYSIKGVPGPKRTWERAKKAKKGVRLFNIAVDNVKTEVLEALGRDPFGDDGTVDDKAIRLSETLPEEWFEQVTNEVRRIKYFHNRPVVEFEPKIKGARVEALDCTVYAWAVRSSLAVKAIDIVERSQRTPPPEPVPDVKPVDKQKKPRTMADIAAALNG